MGIPVEIVGEGFDWPAWFQGVGSVAAIIAAIWIDNGAARRQRDQEARTRAAAKADWEAALAEVGRLAARASEIAAQVDMTDALDDGPPGRLVDNAVMMLDAYLRQPPPTPTLAFALSRARSYLEGPREAIRRRRRSDPQLMAGSYSRRLGAVTAIQETLAEAAWELEVLNGEYRHGILTDI